jgi:transposase
VGHGWFLRGVRSRVKIKLGFQNFYTYAAVSPRDGDEFSINLPKVNAKHMNVYLANLAEKYRDQDILLIMDGAGWHRSKELAVPDSIKIVILPPYSPELNPVERLWQEVKKNVLKNRIYESLQDLEDVVSKCMEALTIETIRSVCHVTYLAYYL